MSTPLGTRLPYQIASRRPPVTASPDEISAFVDYLDVTRSQLVTSMRGWSRAAKSARFGGNALTELKNQAYLRMINHLMLEYTAVLNAKGVTYRFR